MKNLRYPVGVGGVGGSGTRVVAAVLRELGYHLGEDLNDPLDNLWFTLLFKRRGMLTGEVTDTEFDRCWDVFEAAMTGRDDARGSGWGDVPAYLETLVRDGRSQLAPAWLAERADTLLAALRSRRAPGGPWAWKEPNSHLVLDRLARRVPGLRFVLVMRNGLDMAWSANQNQPAFWEGLILPRDAVAPGPPQRAALAYWCAAHRRVLALGRAMGERFHTMNFDRLCAAPAGEIAALFDFLGADADAGALARLSGIVQSPPSIGRYRSRPLEDFDPADVEYVRSLGFA
jgi:hypothetical protein